MSTLDVADRGLAYGDGLFETLRLRHGKPEWWSEHFARLSWGCRQLGLPAPSASDLRARIAAAVAESPPETRGVLKLTYTAGSSARGYRRPDPIWPTVLIQCGPVSDRIAAWQTQGLSVGLQPTKFPGVPHLTGLKHLNRLPQVLCRQTCPEAMDECLMMSPEGLVSGGIQSNFFWFEEGCWHTPPVSGAGIAGTVRAALIASLGVRRTPLAPGRLSVAEAAVMTNSVWGLVPVRTIQGRALSLAPAQGLADRYAVLPEPDGTLPVQETAWWRVARGEPMMNE